MTSSRRQGTCSRVIGGKFIIITKAIIATVTVIPLVFWMNLGVYAQLGERPSTYGFAECFGSDGRVFVVARIQIDETQRVQRVRSLSVSDV